MRRAASAAVGLVIAGGFYLLLIDTVSLPELYAMCGVLVLAAVAYESSRELGFTEATIRARWLRYAWRALLRIGLDMVVVCMDAIAQVAQRSPARGEFRAVPFQGGDGTADHGGAALAELWGSLAPNTIVIGVDSDRGLLIVHQLRRRGGREQLDILRLG